MIDIYIDEMTLSKVVGVAEGFELHFFNKPKDESFKMIVSKNELLNILIQVARRCEVDELISPVNIKRKTQ